ncbi:unnamed protein product [Cunninghamella blakesleeana]
MESDRPILENTQWHTFHFQTEDEHTQTQPSLKEEPIPTTPIIEEETQQHTNNTNNNNNNNSNNNNNIPTNIITTTTTTATFQQYRLNITKTFEDTSSQTTNKDDNSIYETRTSVLLEQMASLHGQLNNILPTRSYYSSTPATSTLTPTDTGSHPSVISSSSCSSLSSPYSVPLTNDSWDDNMKSIDGLSTTSSNSSLNHHHNGEVVFLHPLQAAQEDMNLYETNLNTFKQQADSITEGMKWVREKHLEIMNNTNLITNKSEQSDQNNNDDHDHDHNDNMKVRNDIDINNDDMDINNENINNKVDNENESDNNNKNNNNNEDDDNIKDNDEQNDNDSNNHTDNLMALTTTNNNNQQLTFNQQKKVARISQMEQAYVSLMHRMEQAEKQYLAFHQGFNFSQACHGVRAALHSIQSKMMQKTTTDHDVQALEDSVTSTANQLVLIREQYNELLLNENDSKYEQRWKSIQHKNDIVTSWVEEVKVWFAEAERIRTWIDQRRDQLEETNLPDPMAPLLHEDKLNDDDNKMNISYITKEDLEKSHEWREKHQSLEKEMETFDKQDMARLRAHVKALTGGKDLSPADTTTIEITLTTLTTLDKVMHTLRDKSHKLHLLTQRSLWEKEFETTMDWLHTTENEVDAFLGQARWTLNNQHIMNKSTFIDGLVQLEHKLSDFDKNQFTNTIDSFQDFDDTAQVDLPHYLENRQTNCEQFFEDLFKRLAFVRSVVEQRLELIDFMDIVQHVSDDANQLLIDLKQTCSFFSNDDEHTNNDDDEILWADRVQNIQEGIISLASAQRISYPMATLSIDQEDNEFANQVIRQHVTQQRTSLVLLGESVDEQWQSLRHRWQLRHNVKDLILGADKWKSWADERLRQINENHLHLLEQQEKIINKNQPKNKNFLNMIASALDQINHWERTVSTIKSKLVTKETNIDEFMNKAEQLKKNIYQLNENINDDNCTYITELKHSLNGMNTSYQDLRQLLNTHQQALEKFRLDLEQGNNIIDMRNELWNFVHTLRTSLPNIKQKCGFMTGHSQSQDKERFDTLTQNYQEWQDQLQNKQKLFNQWHHDVQNESLQEDEQLKNNNLISEWDVLVDELKDLGNFKDEVHKWYDRQRKLSLVEHELSLFDEKISMTINNGDADNDDNDDERMIQVGLKQQNILEEIGDTIQLGTSEEGSIMDPLQTANYSCARERYQSLVSKAQQLVNEGEKRKKQKQNTIELQQYKDQVNEFLNLLQSNRDMILERITQHRSQAWAQTMEHNSNALATLIRTTQQATQTMDAQVQHQYRVQREDLRKKKNRILLTQLSAKNNKDETIPNADVDDDDENDHQMNMAMEELEKVMALEKKQVNVFKHLHAYAKAAMDLDHWLVQGNSALLQLTSDIGVIDEVEILATLTRFETKLDNIQPTLQGFQRMHDKIITMADENHMLDDAFKSQMNSSFLKLQQGFDDMKYQLNDIKQSMYRHKHHASIARKMKDILQMIGNYRDRSNNIKLYSDQQSQQQQEMEEKEDDKNKENTVDCLSSALKTCNLSFIPTDHDIELTRSELDKLEQDIQLHLDIALQDLDEALKNEQKENGDDIFTDQRKEITQAITELQQSIKDKKYWLNEAEKLESVLTVLDEWEVLLCALSEVVQRATIPETSPFTRADLQAMLIDLDTRYKYYEPNILSLVKEAQLVMMDVEDPRLIKFYNQLTEQWQQLRRLALEKKNDILSRINPLADPLILSQLYDVIPNGRQQQQRRNIPLTSSVSTLTTSTTVHSNQHDKTLLRKSSFPTKTMTTTRPRPRTATPNSLNGTAPRLMTAERALKRSSWHQQKRQSSAPSFGSINSKNTYVADPKNDLDVAVGNIVNDSPYAIPVKMVPGEVGRYWFGKKNPKLVYCRILRSRIVMVRVGGGWVELSQFLRDHALLEEGRFTSTKGQRLIESNNNENNNNDSNNKNETTVTTTTTDKKKKRHSQPLENPKDINQPVLRHSRSTPFQASTYYCYSARGHSPIPTTHGIKEGNKFVVTDDDGKKVQVTMTKEKNKQTSKFKIPWR